MSLSLSDGPEFSAKLTNPFKRPARPILAKSVMPRVAKLIVALLVLVGCLVFASALFGGLMDDRAFTPAAKEAGH